MDLFELAGIGKDEFHDAAYDKIIDALGGLDGVIPYLPFDTATIKKAYKQDPNLNNLRLSEWEKAAGYRNERPLNGRGGIWMPNGGGIWPLLVSHGVRESTLSQNVCLLKRAAVRSIRPKRKRPDAS